ncbi:pectinesterase-like [Coffea eugenioides]|uniref:pectinesterase-like n=1 Tax=Coffea eugenioides TaxID=49369 RepID=UPI000F60A1EA|nr:pectinesterase-like [Coffea eugenioides]
MGSEGKKKAAILGVSSILLVAAVVGTVTYSVGRHGTETATSGGGSDQVATSSKSVESVCKHVDYKQTCEQSLSGAKNTSDPRELIKLAFTAAVDNIASVIENSTLLQNAAKDPRTHQALETCKYALNTSIEDLQRSFETVGTFDINKIDDYVADLKTWLSAAGTFQETCLDAFENTTGDTGEQMKKLLKTAGELTSNGLAMVTDISEVLTNFNIQGFKRRLMSSSVEPDFVDAMARKLMAANTASLKPNAVVAQDGSGQFKSIMAAVNTVPKKNNQTFVIFIKAGIYKEYVTLPKHVNGIVLVGEGPTKTKITGNKNFVDGVGTFQTPTLSVNGDATILKDLGIENSAGAEKHQAVALRVSGDRTIVYNCQIDAYQDTLYTHTYRQYYRNCTISGTIDFIFGDGSAVFQDCKMVVRKPMENQGCMVTAQGRKERRGIGAIVLQNCQIVADPAFLAVQPPIKAYLGRPWKEFSRTIIMQTSIDGFIAPEGWSPWMGNFGIDTCYYAEYNNRGPGADTSKRVQWKGIKKITPQIAQSFTPGAYIQGNAWITASGVPYAPGMQV